MGRLCYLETLFGVGGDDSISLIGSEGEVNGWLSGKCTLVESGAKIDRVVLSIDIALLTSLLIFSGGSSIFSIIARSLGKESSIKSISWELINFPGVFRFSRQYLLDNLHKGDGHDKQRVCYTIWEYQARNCGHYAQYTRRKHLLSSPMRERQEG